MSKLVSFHTVLRRHFVFNSDTKNQLFITRDANNRSGRQSSATLTNAQWHSLSLDGGAVTRSPRSLIDQRGMTMHPAAERICGKYLSAVEELTGLLRVSPARRVNSLVAPYSRTCSPKSLSDESRAVVKGTIVVLPLWRSKAVDFAIAL